MSFAFGRTAREMVVRNIANLRSFEHGGVSGRTGGCTRLKALPRQYAAGLEDAAYVVYCYDTPIAWVTMEDDATEEGRVNYMPDWQYSATTTYHQGLVWEAWGDKVADPNPRFSRSENAGTPRGRSSDERYGRVPRRERAALPVRPVSARSSFAADAFRTNHRGVRYDSLVERDTAFERDMAEARTRTEPGPDAFRAQDELIDEVRGYSHPAHP